MTINKPIDEDAILRYAQEQFEFHTQKAKYWELVINATNSTSKINGPTIANISIPNSQANINTAFLESLNRTFIKHNYDLKTAKQWYEILKNDRETNLAFPSFYSYLKNLVDAHEIAHIEIPKVPNNIKFWYGSKICLDENKSLKPEYKRKLEENIKNERKKSSH